MLLLCTANQCRSPMAEVLLRHRLGGAAALVQVTSAGLHPGGRPATTHGQEVMAARGLDLSSHESRRLDRTLLDETELVVGMTREHVREVAALDAGAVDRTFTLKELVRAGRHVGARLDDESMADWLARVGAGRRREELIGVGHDEAYDIADPVGGSRRDYEATADELDRLLALLVALAWPGSNHREERGA